MKFSSVTVRVPATSANLGAGFDCLGLALDIWGTVRLRRDVSEAAENRPMERMAIAAALRLYKRLERPVPPLSAEYEGPIPIARGLGASAVARVGALVAANLLEGEPLGEDELLVLASDLEGHADNAAPALLGGFQVAVRYHERILHASLPLPQGLKAVLFVPDFFMSTAESRKLLPESLSRSDTVHNIGRAALMVAAFSRGRFDLLDAASDDRLHQPARSQMFPAMYAIFEAARAAGAHCAYLSGGGSAVCALASGGEETIARAMAEAAASRETSGQTVITAPTGRGAEAVERS